MSLLFMRLGALINGLVILLITSLFVIFQMDASILRSLFLEFNLDLARFSGILGDFLFSGSERIWMPILVCVVLLFGFIIGTIFPFVLANKIISKSSGRVSAFPFFICGLASLPFGGGALIILSSLFGLRSSLSRERDMSIELERRDNNQSSIEPNVEPNTEVVNDTFQDRKTSFTSDRDELQELKNRVNELERRGAYVEDDVYFAQRRDRRRQDNYEMDQDSRRRRDRRGY